MDFSCICFNLNFRIKKFFHQFCVREKKKILLPVLIYVLKFNETEEIRHIQWFQLCHNNVNLMCLCTYQLLLFIYLLKSFFSVNYAARTKDSKDLFTIKSTSTLHSIFFSKVFDCNRARLRHGWEFFFSLDEIYISYSLQYWICRF